MSLNPTGSSWIVNPLSMLSTIHFSKTLRYISKMKLAQYTPIRGMNFNTVGDIHVWYNLQFLVNILSSALTMDQLQVILDSHAEYVHVHVH